MQSAKPTLLCCVSCFFSTITDNAAVNNKILPFKMLEG